MPNRPLLCYITDRTQFPGDESTRRARLLAKITEAAAAGVDYIQLREKDLPGRELESLAREAMQILKNTLPGKTRLLINSRTDVALSTGAGGVHLPAGDISPDEARHIWQQSCSGSAGTLARVTISISCHEPGEVQQAAAQHADFALFAPVFEKPGAAGTKATGLDLLREACQYPIPVLALGGVTLENAAACLAAGAAGIAAIRLFQENDIAHVARKLQSI
jgi:thiamine-phosphate pyrophosphorylase